MPNFYNDDDDYDVLSPLVRGGSKAGIFVDVIKRFSSFVFRPSFFVLR